MRNSIFKLQEPFGMLQIFLESGPRLNTNTVFLGMEISMLQIKRSRDIYNMGIPIQGIFILRRPLGACIKTLNHYNDFIWASKCIQAQKIRLFRQKLKANNKLSTKVCMLGSLRGESPNDRRNPHKGQQCRKPIHGFIMYRSYHMHYNDVIMMAMASQITGVSIVYSSVCSAEAQIKEKLKLRVAGLCDGNSPVTGEYPRTKGQ